MTNSICKTPAEFDRAIKKAAGKAEGDTEERYAPRRVEIIQDERPHGRRHVRAYPVANS